MWPKIFCLSSEPWLNLPMRNQTLWCLKSVPINLFKWGVAVGLLMGAALSAHAQVLPLFPGKPVEITVGFAPGGGVDILARLIAQHLSGQGQAIVVENRPGAGSTLAAQ